MPASFHLPLRRRLLGAAAALAAAPLAAFGHHAVPHIPRIYMIVYRGETPVEQGFRDWFDDNRLQAEFLLRSVDLDLARLPALLAEARAWHADLIYTWGTPLTLAVAGKEGALDPSVHVTDIPIVFTMVSAPLGAGLVRSLLSSQRNLTGVSHVVPVPMQMNAIRQYRKFERIAAIYNPAEINSVLNVREMRIEAERIGCEFQARPVPLDDRGQPRADALPGMLADIAEERFQLLYMGPDSFLATQRKLITETALELRLPVFAAAEVALREGRALFGLVAGYANVGRLTAHKAAQILYHRVKPAAIPIETPGTHSYLVNMEVARQLGLNPPNRVLKIAEQMR